MTLSVKTIGKCGVACPGESYTGVFRRSVQQNGYWSKDPKYRLGTVFKGDWQVTSRYITTERVTPVRCLVMQFTSWSQATATCFLK